MAWGDGKLRGTEDAVPRSFPSPQVFHAGSFELTVLEDEVLPNTRWQRQHVVSMAQILVRKDFPGEY
jgi:hypothetical protein